VRPGGGLWQEYPLLEQLEIFLLCSAGECAVNGDWARGKSAGLGAVGGCYQRATGAGKLRCPGFDFLDLGVLRLPDSALEISMLPDQFERSAGGAAECAKATEKRRSRRVDESRVAVQNCSVMSTDRVSAATVFAPYGIQAH
jgi:hypothetical protein